MGSDEEIDKLLSIIDYGTQIEDKQALIEKELKNFLEKEKETVIGVATISMDGFKVASATDREKMKDFAFNLASAISVIYSTSKLAMDRSVGETVSYTLVKGRASNIIILDITPDYLLSVIFKNVQDTARLFKQILLLRNKLKSMF